jgi:hypothetical protein
MGTRTAWHFQTTLCYFSVPLGAIAQYPVDTPLITYEVEKTSNRTDGPRFKFAIAACARWEEHDIVEWIEYHRMIGFDHIYIYSNDDDPMVLHRVLLPYLLGNEPFVTYRYWARVGDQAAIYLDFLSNYLHEVEWFSFLDIDEFFVFKGIDNVRAFMKPFEGISDAVYFNWLIFGNNMYQERDTGSVLLKYTQRQRNIHFTTKVISRSSAIDPETVRIEHSKSAHPFWHFWNEYFHSDLRIVNALSQSITNYTEHFPKRAIQNVTGDGVSEALIEIAFIAHFQFKSEQDFQRRISRGGFPNAEHWSQLIADGRHQTLLQELNDTSDTYLASFWLRKAGNAYDFREGSNPGEDLDQRHNVAFRKPTQQSSVDHEAARTSPVNAYALGHGNDGIRRGSFGFHTLGEDHPWWSVDLLDQFLISEIRLYNRVETPELADRSRFIAVEIRGSDDWKEIFTLDGRSTFGGVYRNDPLIIKLETPQLAQQVRIISRRPTILHLDEVEVYGVSSSLV